MDFARMTAPCGLDCFNCPMYLANEDADLKEKIAANLGISPELASCRGCREEGGVIAFQGMKEPCQVFRCIAARGHGFCYECDDFPCDHLHPYADQASRFPHNTKVFNLCLIKKMGLENWAVEKARRVKGTYFKGKFRL